MNSDEILWRVECMTGNSWLDFDNDPDLDEDTGIFKKELLLLSYKSNAKLHSSVLSSFGGC